METFAILILSCLLAYVLGNRRGYKNGYRQGHKAGLSKAELKRKYFDAMSEEQKYQYLQVKVDTRKQEADWRMEDATRKREWKKEDEEKQRESDNRNYQRGLNMTDN